MKNKKLLIKIGSSLILKKESINLEHLSNVVKQIAGLKKKGYQIILVSSGAIVLGKQKMGPKKSWSENLPFKQASAAVGQPELMNIYKNFFGKQNLSVAQILLTQEDISSQKKYLNVKNTLSTLIENEIIPIINENDTTATEEIKFGDNDILAALTAVRIEADLLIILSDVDGLYQSKKKIIKEVEKITPKIESLAKPQKSKLTRGGMKSKIEAAKIVSSAGIPCIIANGKKKNILLKLMAGEKIGTSFLS